MNCPAQKVLYKISVNTVILLCTLVLSSCNSYSTLSFNNKSKVPVTLKYIQEDGNILEQKIGVKEDLRLMFKKKWTDKNIRNVVSNIKGIVIYTPNDTILNVSNKKALFEYFKQSRSMVMDNIDLKIVD